MNIVISINPEYVNKIIIETKKFEYRTRIPKYSVQKLFIYETAPIKKVVAEVEIVEILALEPNALREETKEFSGVTKAFFDEYFKGRKVAYAYKSCRVKVYKEPKNLNEFGLETAPQSYAYAKKNFNEKNSMAFY